jgi:hypothetical protein
MGEEIEMCAKLKCYSCLYEWEGIAEEVEKCPYCWATDWNDPNSKGSVRINGKYYHGMDEIIIVLKKLGVPIRENAQRYTW